MKDENATTEEQRDQKRTEPASELASFGVLVTVMAVTAAWFVLSAAPYVH